VSVDDFASLSERVLGLERQISIFSNRPHQIEGRIECQEEELESLRFALGHLQTSLKGEIKEPIARLGQLQPTPKLSPSPPESLPATPTPAPSPSPKPEKVQATVFSDERGQITR
jgi:hypothetical protein